MSKTTGGFSQVPLLRERGTYLITGGASGIGRLFAEFLAKHVRARLALVGRSAPDARTAELLQSLQAVGGEGAYVRADVTDRAQVRTLVEQVKARFGTIHGVIHSAGVIRDALLTKKVRADMRAVLAPKVQGVLNLDEALEDEPLDVFILFSSLAAVIGNVGQADYAYANAFLDRFAERRELLRGRGERSGRTLSLNWPFWREGGMSLDKASEAYMTHVMGLWPLDTAAGFQAFVDGLNSPLSQFMVVVGDRQKAARTLGLPGEAPATPAGGAVLPASKPGDTSGLLPRAESFLKALIAQETKVPVEQLDPTEPLERYGVDSLVIVGINTALQQHFGDISRTLLFEYRTTRELAEYFVAQHAPRLLELVGGAPSTLPSVEPALLAPRESPAPSRDLAPGREALQVVREEEEDIAIIGVSGRYPMAEDLWEYWDNLKSGRNCITEIPLGRWEHHPYFDADKDAEGKSYTKWGGFLSGVDLFDALFFNISTREAEGMDPQERLFLQTVWSLFEDAGYTRQTLAPRAARTGVFVGVMYGQYEWLGVEAALRGRASRAQSGHWSIANRISYFFNFQGPSLAVDTACSSSLTAIHLACQSLRSGECEQAVVGGVNLSIHPHKYTLLSQGRFASSEGLCRSFGEGGDGYVPGEGIGAILLKPLRKALAEGDRVYALVKGSALNHGGKTNGYTVPDPNAQAGVITEALRRARVEPRDIGYLEAHGTGTSLGDPIEITGLTKAFGPPASEQGRCPLGSVKSNIGHLEAAAGIAGVTKVLLQLQHRQLAPSLHSEPPNPNIRFTSAPFFVQKELAAWPAPAGGQPRRAAVSSFGAGGANAHVVLEEFRGVEAAAPAPAGPWLFPLSAKSPERLWEAAARLKRHVQERMEADGARLCDVAFTLQVGREPMEERLALLADSKGALLSKLEAFLEGRQVEGLYRGKVKGSGRKQALLSADEEDARQLLEGWSRRGKLSNLAEVWVEGAVLEWRLLWPEGGRRVSLPTYPFARERHWVEPAALEGGLVGEHPLLGRLEPAESLGSGLVFRQRLSEEAWVVAEHRVRGRAMLPGVAYLEMACAAVRQAVGPGGYELRQVKWMQPLVVEGRGREVRLALSQGEEGGLDFVVRSQGAEPGDWTTHAQGEIRVIGSETGGAETAVALEEVRARCTQHLEGREAYQRFESLGLGYGEGFRTVRELWSNGEEVLARLEASPTQREAWGRWGLPPGMLDGALQSILGVGKWEGFAVPFAVEDVVVRRAVPAEAYAYVKQVGPLRYEVAVLDGRGEVCVELKEVALRVWKEERAGAEEMLYVPRWEVSEVEGEKRQWSGEGSGPRVVVVSSEDSGVLEQELVRVHREEGVVRVRLGERTRQQGPGEWEWNSADEEGAKGWLREAAGMKRLYFLGGLEGGAARSVEQEGVLERGQERGVVGLFRLVKVLSAGGQVVKPLEVRVVTGNAHRVVEGEKPRPGGASVQGFVKAVANEYPALRVSYVDVAVEELEGEGRARVVKGVVEEPAQGKGGDVALRQGRRYVRRLLPVQLRRGREVLRQRGVYVLVGGGGGIGLEVAGWLARSYQARLVVVGRREEKGELASKLREVEQAGGEVLYVQADVTQPGQARRVVERARERFGAVHGVFHLAMVLQDRSLERMDEQTLRAVLDSKVKTSVEMQAALEGEPLECVVFFSSGQSIWGNAGQANYAAGCTFQDAYGAYLREVKGLPAYVLNWGYWGSVGAVANAQHQQRLAQQGILSIEVDEGMEGMAAVLAGGAPQVMLFKASRQLLERMGVDYSRRVEVYAPGAEGLEARAMEAAGQWGEQAGGRLKGVKEAYAEVEQWGRALLLQAMRKLGAVGRAGEEWEEGEKARQVGVVEEHGRLWRALVGVLERGGYVRRGGRGVRVLEKAEQVPDARQLEEWKQRLLTAHPELKHLIGLLQVCLESYPEVLTGRREAMAVLFPQASMEQVERVYKGNAIADFFNGLVANAVRAYVRARVEAEPGTVVRILEVGAGTGGTSEHVLAALADLGGHVRYLYTDVSAGFVQHGAKKYGREYAFLEPKVLNIETDPSTQGLEPGSIDVVLATNVLHATRGMGRTLGHIQGMLRSGGLLVVNELTRVWDFTTLIFGMTQGWWLFEQGEGRLESSPLLDRAGWRRLLAETGFARAEAVPHRTEAGQDVMIARSTGQVLRALGGTASAPGAMHEEAVEKRLTVRSVKPPAPARRKQAPVPPAMDLQARTLAYVTSVFSTILKIAPSRFDPQATFETYGVDSLVNMEVLKQFRQDFGSLPATLLFEHMTIEMLATYFMKEHGERLLRVLGGEEAAVKEEDASPAAPVQPLADDTLSRQRSREPASLPRPLGGPGDELDSIRTYVESLSGEELDLALRALLTAPAQDS
jgi:acyl transferase domain-containing protein/NAD(P)-dependent dehydrogenase (short-subunit alcohol dehydrogenase family)/acyl carrier protein/SAM-dependent methyltransferase/aryl carrier-like protein